jgi:multidrug efflux pump subunit AcrB
VPLQELVGGFKNGLVMSIVAIFLLLAANFQSLRLSLVVVSTVPAVIAGVVLALWLTRTTLNIQSGMGAIMAVGVAVANAILLVTFAERSRIASGDAYAAAIDGAKSRLRPIVMTSSAMLAGMLPLALGLGQGGDETAPLGRAVIGGLAAATLATLYIVPPVFALLRRDASTRARSLDPDDELSGHFVSPLGHD